MIHIYRLSVCLIVKNEHDTLARCLDSVKTFADEIVVVDTGSSDDTREIAKKYTDKVCDFEWNDDFSEARNFSFAKAENDYVMWIDADDVVRKDQARAIEALKKRLDGTVDVIMMKYCAAFDCRKRPTFWYYRERIVKKGFQFSGAVHEAITPSGNVVYSDVEIEHHSNKKEHADRNLRIYRKMEAENREFTPRDLYYFARELYYNGLYEEAVSAFRRFLESDGWVEDKISGCLLLAQCFAALGRREEQLLTLYKSCEYDRPRAGVCCALGSWHLEGGFLQTAVFWFESAKKCPAERSGFVSEDDRSFTPNLMLCVCYDRLGDRKKAEQYNREAYALKPDDPSVAHNLKYFASLRAEKNN